LTKHRFVGYDTLNNKKEEDLKMTHVLNKIQELKGTVDDKYLLRTLGRMEESFVLEDEFDNKEVADMLETIFVGVEEDAAIDCVDLARMIKQKALSRTMREAERITGSRMGDTPVTPEQMMHLHGKIDQLSTIYHDLLRVVPIRRKLNIVVKED
jgi:hypothetical protein